MKNKITSYKEKSFMRSTIFKMTIIGIIIRRKYMKNVKVDCFLFCSCFHCSNSPQIWVVAYVLIGCIDVF